MRAATTVVSTVLMFFIITVLMAEVFLYGIPLLKKRIEVAQLSNLQTSLLDLSEKLVDVAFNGGELRVRVPAVRTTSAISNIALKRLPSGLYYISVEISTEAPYFSSQCVTLNDNLPVFTGSTLVEGTFGVNRPIALCAKSEKAGALFITNFYLVPRPLNSKDEKVLIEFTPYPGKSIKTTLPAYVVFRKVDESLETLEGITYHKYILEVGFE